MSPPTPTANFSHNRATDAKLLRNLRMGLFTLQGCNNSLRFFFATLRIWICAAFHYWRNSSSLPPTVLTISFQGCPFKITVMVIGWIVVDMVNDVAAIWALTAAVPGIQAPPFRAAFLQSPCDHCMKK